MNHDRIVREQLLALLQGGNAHMSFEDAVADYPPERINDKPPNTPYSAWQLLEHLRIAQWDILEFIRDPDHQSPQWPRGYWPDPNESADEARWAATIEAFQADLNDLISMLDDPKIDLYADLPHATGYTILRELLLVADHNAYHIGEFGVLRQVMETWER